MQLLEKWHSFAGEQQIWQHQSAVLNCDMNVAVYLPTQALNNADHCPVVYWLSGLTCTERNFIEKSGFQRIASELGLIVVAPDTSPRGEAVADDKNYDLGQGAGFYVNATQSPWRSHYQMYDYVVQELPALITQHFPHNGKQSISGHSMGGHGALMIALKNPNRFASVSAFAPIVAPSQVPWGQKAFTAYLGDDTHTWQQYDATYLLGELASSTKKESADTFIPTLISQGMADSFLSQLQPETFITVATANNILITVEQHEGYDHSYYFVASFIEQHLRFHHQALQD